MMARLHIDSPIGPLTLVEERGYLVQLDFGTHGVVESETSPVLEEAVRQLNGYFKGERRAFDLPLNPRGTEFQRKVWQALCTIDYGATISYKQLAESVGSPKAYRAVGNANSRNPIPVIIPCHRVIGADGKLVGYGGGVTIKACLLDMEKRVER